MIDPLHAREPLLVGRCVFFFSWFAMVVLFGTIMFLVGPPVSFVPHPIPYASEAE